MRAHALLEPGTQTGKRAGQAIPSSPQESKEGKMGPRLGSLGEQARSREEHWWFCEGKGGPDGARSYHEAYVEGAA